MSHKGIVSQSNFSGSGAALDSVLIYFHVAHAYLGVPDQARPAAIRVGHRLAQIPGGPRCARAREAFFAGVSTPVKLWHGAEGRVPRETDSTVAPAIHRPRSAGCQTREVQSLLANLVVIAAHGGNRASNGRSDEAP